MANESDGDRELTQGVSARPAEALGVSVYVGGGPSLMYAASAIAAFDEFAAAAPVQRSIA